MKSFLVKKHNYVAIIQFNRPEKLNSLNPLLIEEMQETISILEKDKDVKVLVLTGKGKAFSAGGDIDSMAIKVEGDKIIGKLDMVKKINDLVLKLYHFHKPTIAAINGLAVGAGLSLALACDVIFMSDSAWLSQSFLNVGLIPDGGGTYFLTKKLGENKAKEYFFTGKKIQPGEALEVGLVNHVVKADELEKEVIDFASDLSNKPQVAIFIAKKIINSSQDSNLEMALQQELLAQTICLQSEDHKKLVSDFLNKK